MRIAEPGLSLSFLGTLVIDTNAWTTQAQLTKKLGCNRNTVSQLVRRGIKNGTLKTFYIDAIDTRLIPNVKTINELREITKITKK